MAKHWILGWATSLLQLNKTIFTRVIKYILFMKILLILLMFLIGLLGAIKIFITWCFATREKWEDFCNEVLFLVRKEKIPIMEDVVVLGLLASDGFKGITDDNENTYAAINTRNFCGFHNLFVMRKYNFFISN